LLQGQAATSLPFVTAGHAAPTAQSAAELDAACEGTLCSNHVAKVRMCWPPALAPQAAPQAGAAALTPVARCGGQRASIAQGKGFLAAVSAAFAGAAALAAEIKSNPDFCGHLAPLFGIFSRCPRASARRCRAARSTRQRAPRAQRASNLPA